MRAGGGDHRVRAGLADAEFAGEAVHAAPVRAEDAGTEKTFQFVGHEVKAGFTTSEL
jgi:hypothetical protein